MSLSRIFAIILRVYYLMRSSPGRLVQNFIWVLIDIVLWGFITRYLSNVTQTGIPFTSMLLGAVVMWGFFVRVTHSVAVTFLEDVWSRNFPNMFASPLRIGEYLAGLVAVAIVMSLLGLTAMLALATFAFGFSALDYGILIVPFLFILFLFGIAIGIGGTALILRYGPVAEWFIWPIPAMIAPFVGVFYPLAVLPGWMQTLGHALPPAYVFESVRAILAGGPAPWADLALGTALAAGYIALACHLFARVHAYVVKTGLIARYGAESVV